MRDWDAVFWDVGGVLLNIESVFAAQTAFVGRLADTAGIDPDAALEAYRGVLRDHFTGRTNREYRTAREGRQKAVTAILGDQSADFDWRAVYDEIQREHLELNDGAAEAVRRLEDAGFYLGVISDADADRPAWLLRHFGLDSSFDGITTSEEVGYTKPDHRMFETALAKAEVAPERAIMIGDKYENDIEGAASAGLTAVGYGADQGPAIDYSVENLREVLGIVGIEP